MLPREQRDVFCSRFYVFQKHSVSRLTRIVFRIIIKHAKREIRPEVFEIQGGCFMATLGCIRATMGETEYYITKIAAGELIEKVGIAKEMPEWPDMTAEEKMQRECDIRRIVEEIVPYVEKKILL